MNRKLKLIVGSGACVILVSTALILYSAQSLEGWPTSKRFVIAPAAPSKSLAKQVVVQDARWRSDRALAREEFAEPQSHEVHSLGVGGVQIEVGEHDDVVLDAAREYRNRTRVELLPRDYPQEGRDLKALYARIGSASEKQKPALKSGASLDWADFSKHSRRFVCHHPQWGLRRSIAALSPPLDAPLRLGRALQVDLDLGLSEGAASTGARAFGASLACVNMVYCKFIDSSFGSVDMREVSGFASEFVLCDFRKARIDGDFRYSAFFDCDFSGAVLSGDFRNAHFSNCEFGGAVFRDIRVAGLELYSLPSSTMGLPELVRVEGLTKVIAPFAEHELFRWRDWQESRGQQKSSRAIDAAIARQEGLNVDQNGVLSLTLAGAVSRVGLGWTVEYGYNPWRAAGLLLALIPGFALVYAIALKVNHGSGFWWVKPQDDLLFVTESRVRFQQVVIAQGARGMLDALVLGMRLSITSAFGLGTSGARMGKWMESMHPSERRLRTAGGIKVVSGLQSLVSVGLIAVWILALTDKLPI